MAGIGGDLAGIMSIMQRNKALREDRRQFNARMDQQAIEHQDRMESDEANRDVQNRRTDIYAGNLAIAQAEEARAAEEAAATARREQAGTMLGQGTTLGYIGADGALNGSILMEGVANGDYDANEYATSLFNSDPRRFQADSGFQITEFDTTSQPGSVIMRGAREDGTPGVVTQNGTDDPEDPVVVLSAEEFALALNGASKANFSRSMTAEEGRRLGLETELSESLVDAVYADSTIPKQEQRQTEALIYNVADTNSEALYQIADELGLDYTRFATPTQTAENGNQYFGKTEDGNWLSYATEEEQSAAYDRGEISQTTNTTPKTGQFASESAAPAEETNVSPAVVSARGKNRMQRSKELADRRRDSRIEQLPSLLAEAEADLAAIEKKFADEGRNVRPDHPTLQSRKDDITKLKMEMEEAGISLAPATPVDIPPVPKGTPLSELEATIERTLTELPAEQIEQMVDDGSITVTQEDVAESRTILQQSGVRGPQDLDKVDVQHIGKVYATLMSMSDSQERVALRKQFNNFLATGSPGVSYGDVTSRINAIKPTDKGDKWDRDAAVESSNQFRQRFRGEPANDKPGESASTLLPEIAAFIEHGDPRNIPIYKDALNEVMGAAIAEATNENESWLGWFGIKKAEADSTDWDLDNLRVVDGQMYYLNNGVSRSSGSISKGQLASKLGSSSAANAAWKIAEENTGTPSNG